MSLPNNPVEILQELIRCPSVTPEEGGALDYLEKLLTAAGFVCTRLPFSAPDTPSVDNLFARIGTGQPHLCFAGHTDVVPPGDEASWKHPPFAGVITGDTIHGRGACDMKGSVAAFVVAALQFAAEHGNDLPGSVSLLITGDEEGPAINGTVKVLKWLADNDQVPDHCIVGEPTSSEAFGDMIKIGRRGSIHFQVTVKGVQGHSAYPHKADNPLPKLARLIDRVASAKLDDGTEHFDPSTLAVTKFDVGNTANNVIPERAVASFNIRFNTEHTYESLKAWVQQHCDAVTQQLGGNFEIETTENAKCFQTAPGPATELLAAAVEAETGLTPQFSTSGGTSDARFIKDYCPVMEFGPLNETIHQVDERLSISELHGTTRIYLDFLHRYFAGPGNELD